MTSKADGGHGSVPKIGSGGFLLLVGLLVALALPASASASASLSWSAPQLIDPPLLFSPANIIGVSCPSTSLCVAIDENASEGHILHSTDPASDGAVWATASMGKFDYPKAVSCPSPSFCAVADNRGNVLISSEPTGGIGTWTKVPLDAQAVTEERSFGLLDVSCPSQSFCAAIDDLGNVFASADPTGGVGAWTETDLGDTDLESIACQSSALCVITDFHGNVLTSSDPTGGPSAWHSANIDASGLGGVACPSASLCVVGGFFGDVFTSTEPTGSSAAWNGANVDGSGYLLSLSCPSVSFCAAVDSFGGNVVTSTNPASGASAWSAVHLAEPDGLFAVSCSSKEFCVAGSGGGHVVVGTLEEEPEGGKEEGPSGGGGGQGNPPAVSSTSSVPTPSQVASPSPHKTQLKCRKGFRKRQVHGKARCVRVQRKRHRQGAAS